MAPAEIEASLICTVMNEESSLDEFIESLLSQSRPSEEIVLVDGGSNDGTVAIISKFIAMGAPIKLYIAEGNRAIGRNVAVRKSTGRIIACTDAGCRVDRDWFKNILTPFETDPSVDVVAGFYLPEPSTALEECFGLLSTPALQHIKPESFLASTRSIAFKRTAWERVGGFPELFNWNEDTPFNVALKAAGCKYKFVPEALVYWKPMTSLRAFVRQYFQFTRGDGQTGLFMSKYLRVALKYLLTLMLLVLGLWKIELLVPAALIWAAYLMWPAIANRKRIRWKQTLFLLPFVLIIMHFTVVLGYIAGRIERVRNPVFQEWKVLG